MKSSKTQDSPPAQPSQPPTLGLAAMASLWLFGTILFVAPSYLGIDAKSGWQLLFYGPGLLVLAISIGGAVVELGKLWRSQAVNHFGVGLVFIIPAVLCHLALTYALFPVSDVLATIGRIVVLILVVLGGAFIFYSVAYLAWERSNERVQPENGSNEPKAPARATANSKSSVEILAPLIIALLSLASAIFGVIDKILPLLQAPHP